MFVLLFTRGIRNSTAKTNTRILSLSHFHSLTRSHVSGNVEETLQTGVHALVETQWKLTRLFFTFQSHFGGGESGSVCCLQHTLPSEGGILSHPH